MTKEHAYAYEAGYQDGLRAATDELKEENAKLREQIHWLKKGDIFHVLTDLEFDEQLKHEREMQASIKALDDENEKLRELVKRMYYDLTHVTFPPRWLTDYEADMRELEIEVDE